MKVVKLFGGVLIALGGLGLFAWAMTMPASTGYGLGAFLLTVVALLVAVEIAR